MRTELRGRSPNPGGDGALTPVFAAVAVAAQLLALDLTPHVPAEPFATVWHFLAYASITVFLWIATGGRRPIAVPAGVVLLGVVSFDLLVATAAASLVAGTLFFMQGKPACAESSPR